MINRYGSRPRELNHLSLAEFATMYEYKRGNSADFNKAEEDFDEDNFESEEEIGTWHSFVYSLVFLCLSML